MVLGEGRRLSSVGQGRWQEMLLGDSASIGREMIRCLNSRGRVEAHSLETSKVEAMIIIRKIRMAAGGPDSAEGQRWLSEYGIVI